MKVHITLTVNNRSEAAEIVKRVLLGAEFPDVVVKFDETPPVPPKRIDHPISAQPKDKPVPPTDWRKPEYRAEWNLDVPDGRQVTCPKCGNPGVIHTENHRYFKEQKVRRHRIVRHGRVFGMPGKVCVLFMFPTRKMTTEEIRTGPIPMPFKVQREKNEV